MGCYTWFFLDHFFSGGRCLCLAYFPRSIFLLEFREYRRRRGCVSREKGPLNMLLRPLILGAAGRVFEGPGLGNFGQPFIRY